jgi:hypothetical protein
MFYCGLDVAMKSSYVYITDSRGTRKPSGEVPTIRVDSSQRLRPYLRRGLAVALGAGSQSAWTCDLLVEPGEQVPRKLLVTAYHVAREETAYDAAEVGLFVDEALDFVHATQDGLEAHRSVPPGVAILDSTNLPEHRMRRCSSRPLPAPHRAASCAPPALRWLTAACFAAGSSAHAAAFAGEGKEAQGRGAERPAELVPPSSDREFCGRTLIRSL